MDLVRKEITEDLPLVTDIAQNNLSYMESTPGAPERHRRASRRHSVQT